MNPTLLRPPDPAGIDGRTGGVRRRCSTPFVVQTLRFEAAMQHHDLLSRAVSTDREITLEALRVFTYLSRRLHFDRSVPVLQSELADALGMQRPNVNRAIKLLENKQILLRDSKLGRAITFRLNPGLEGGRA
ncbi:helix-turn-helix domain-containing protein [Azospirillum thermophilum]|uniref:helix-turn-helix domain-containing protein n=1 Tax=Azospirillum thermophilum TaxID=2202148 RepID=UPI001FE84202|nr:helix-turn-helix domain-containing protein [Azospirillum thermophilum]